MKLVAEQIRQLSKPHMRGVLTDTEFAQAKTRLVDDA
jgi:hypothetical protein